MKGADKTIHFALQTRLISIVSNPIKVVVVEVVIFVAVFVQKKFRSKEILVQKNLGSNTFWSKKDVV